LTLLAIGLLTATLIMMNSRKSAEPKTHQELFAAYYELPHLSGTYRSAEEEKDTLGLIQAAFDESRFDSVLQLSQYVTIGKLGTEDGLMIAVSYMESGEWSKAVIALEAINPESEYFRDYIPWLKTMAYLQLSQLDKAKELLGKIIVDKDHDFHESASGLLKDLESARAD
jgi:hypothetical protein